MTNSKQAIRTVVFSVLSNLLLAIVKFFAGVFGNSYALIADGIESTADVFSSLLVLFGMRYANRPPDENHPYGHGKAEPLMTFIVVGFLIVSAVVIAYQSVINMQSPKEMPKAWTLYILGAIIIWKEISYRKVIRSAKKLDSTALEADAWHHRSDAITSIAAFVGISVALLLGEGYEAADDVAALFAAGFILYNSYRIFRPALGEVMDEHRYDELENEIRKISLTVPGVKGTEKCLVRKNGMYYLVDLHALVNAEISVKEGHRIAHDLQDALIEAIPSIDMVLVHIEPFNPEYNTAIPPEE
ncbi:MAG TPA: cation diffusion facilitator family transporter [Flavobacteriaceae bacterium]|nr:cation diffusion facilitator family transporter [Flavobacteriaceae bacterium]